MPHNMEIPRPYNALRLNLVGSINQQYYRVSNVLIDDSNVMWHYELTVLRVSFRYHPPVEGCEPTDASEVTNMRNIFLFCSSSTANRHKISYRWSQESDRNYPNWL